jgi:hypothetical protein
MGRVLIAALAAAAIGISTPAVAAITIGGSGASTTLTINGSTAVNDFVLLTLNGQADNVVYPGLSSTLKLTFKGASANLDGGTTFLFDYLISNTSSTGSRVTAFGFDINPLASFDLAKSKPGTGETYDIQASGSLANNSLDFCLKNGQDNNCGGSQGGPAAGSSGSGTFKLYFDTTTSSLTLSNIIDRYQGIDGAPGSAEGFVTSPPVPEPATWAMMLVGFGGIGLAMRRRRKVGSKLLQIA